MDSNNFKDRRKYQRVAVDPYTVGLSVEVLGYGQTSLFDMSYEGAAFTQPSEQQLLNVGEEIQIRFWTNVDQAILTAKTIRVSPQAVAVHFTDVNVDARIIVDRLVTDRIVGLNLSFIDPKHYNAGADFTHWYHGPKDTNLYLWWSGSELVRAQFEMSQASVVYEDESFFFESAESGVLNNKQIAHKAHSILQQVASVEPAFLQFRKMIEEHVQA